MRGEVVSMYVFPKNLYTDVRIETVTSSSIAMENGRLVRNKAKTDKGVMIRIYDGTRWYYNAITDLNRIQEAIDQLASMASPREEIYECPEIKLLEVNQAKVIRYDGNSVDKIDNVKKLELVKGFHSLTTVSDKIKYVWAFYRDEKVLKHFISSKGADVEFDKQIVHTGLFYSIVDNEIPTEGRKMFVKSNFEDCLNREKEIKEELEKDLTYARDAKPVIAGDYPCILSPAVAGVFAHESFGHKSEADFMMNDESMKKEWVLGKKVGSDNLSILDGGDDEYHGYTPYDDEGTKAKTTYLIKNGVLSGRLHNSVTATCLEEELTGNARAINFEYEPIVRMTNTYIAGGTQTSEELFESIHEGIYVDGWNHGSGMSTFTIAPSKAYMIRNGQIAEPVRVSVITGNVMDTLHLIDGISKVVDISEGWCGKNEQSGLPVGQGAPYIRVSKLRVQ